MSHVVSMCVYGIVSVKRDLTYVFSRFQFFYILEVRKCLKCPLHMTSYTLRIEVSVRELQGAEYLISHTQALISIARTGNFIMYALGPFSRKRSHTVCVYICRSCGMYSTLRSWVWCVQTSMHVVHALHVYATRFVRVAYLNSCASKSSV